MSRSMHPDVTTVFHDWTYGGLVQVGWGLGREVLVSPIKAANLLGGTLGNSRNVPMQTKVITDVQTKKTDVNEFLSWSLVHN